MKKTSIFAVAALALVTSAFADTVTISTADGNGADTFLTNDSNSGSTVAHGTSTSMELRNQTGVRFRALYFRFDISDYIGQTFSDATITLNATAANRSRGLQIYGINDTTTAGNGNNWDEATTTYSTASGYSNGLNDGNYTISVDQTASVLATTTGCVVGLNTTTPNSMLDTFLNSDTDGLVTFTVYIGSPWNGSEDLFFTTKEGGIAPTLTFNAVSAVPEPSTYAALAGMVMLGAAAYRRRKQS